MKLQLLVLTLFIGVFLTVQSSSFDKDKHYEVGVSNEYDKDKGYEVGVSNDYDKDYELGLSSLESSQDHETNVSSDFSMTDSLEEESVSSSPSFSEEEGVSISPDVSEEEFASEEELAGQAVWYVLKTSGKCTGQYSYVKSADACHTAAKALKLYAKPHVQIVSGGKTNEPTGCYFKKNYNGRGNSGLKFDTGTNTGSCDRFDMCLCKTSMKKTHWRVTSVWSSCPDRCYQPDSIPKQTRSVACFDDEGKKIDESFCKKTAESFWKKPKPATERNCVSTKKCEMSWTKVPKKCCAPGHHTKCGPGGSLSGTSCLHQNTSLDQCGKKCASASWCKTFEFANSSQHCWLFWSCTKVNSCPSYNIYNKGRYVQISKWKVNGKWHPRHCPTGCSPKPSSVKQIRTVLCVDTNGKQIRDSYCTSNPLLVKPSVEKTCAPTKKCDISWKKVANECCSVSHTKCGVNGSKSGDSCRKPYEVSFQECKKQCAEAAWCTSIQYSENDAYNRKKICWLLAGCTKMLKSCTVFRNETIGVANVLNIRDNRRLSTYVKSVRYAPITKVTWSKVPRKCCSVGHHTQCGVGGSLIGNACKHSNTSHAQCKKKCASASWCKFFEYPRSHSTCWLFHECTKVNDCSGYDTYNKVVRHVSLTGGKWKVVGEWSPRHCPKDCGQSASKQRRSVICVDADGEKVEDSLCTNVKLATERTCKATKQCVFTKQADQCCTIAGTTCGPDGSLKGNRCFYGVMSRRQCKRKCSGYAWCKQMVYSNDGQQKCYLENSCMNVNDNCKFDRFLKGSDYNENAATVQPYNFTKHANQCCTTAATKCGPGGSVKGKSCNYHSMTLHQCQKKCTSKSWCKHVEYGSDNQNCWLYHSCGHVKKCTSFDTFAKGEGYVAPKRSFALPIPKPRNIIRNFYDMLSKKFTKHSKQCCVASATTCGTDGSSAGSNCYAGVMSLGKCQAKCKGKSWCNHVVYSNTGSNKCWLEHSCTANLSQCTSYDRFIRKDRDHQSRLFTKQSNKCCHASATYCGWPHRNHKGSQCYKGRMTLAKCTEMCTNNFWCKSAVFHREKNYCWLESECAKPINYCQKFDRYVKKPRGSSTSEMNEMEESVSVAYADDGKFE